MDTTTIDFENLSSPKDRYLIENVLGTGAFAKVLLASDSQVNNKTVAIKTVNINPITKSLLQQEYQILANLSNHANLPDFYGIHRTDEEIWFVLEVCEGGSVLNLVKSILMQNRRMREEHIAYILKDTVKAIIYLHEKNVIHRDIKAKNILLTKNGEVKLTDFNCSVTSDKSGDLIGSPCWMAPELVNSHRTSTTYDNRVDVWSLGVTAIELGDGITPFSTMHPTRALFQIVTNPPPTLARTSNWTESFNDFIGECLVKNPEHRPYMVEVVEHPFLEQIPENNYHLTLEIKAMVEDAKHILLNDSSNNNTLPETVLIDKCLKNGINEDLETMYVEDLSSLEKITEKRVIHELESRFKLEQFQTFIGDVLVVINPNEEKNIYGHDQHPKYQCKSRSDNAPHIFSVADSAYQNALHHSIPQKIVLSGESGSGKTTNYLHLINHLLYLGENKNINLNRLKNAIKIIHSFTHASTPSNEFATCCVLTTEIKYGNTGKVTGAKFNVNQLEKWRISSVEMSQGNFHALYYIHDGLKNINKCKQFELTLNREEYRYLRINDDEDNKSLSGPRSTIEENINNFQIISKTLKEFDVTDDEMDILFKIVAAILNIGQVRFQAKDNNSKAIIENRECVGKVARLLEINEEKLCWVFTNYCMLHKGAAVRGSNTVDEARDARDVLANTLYARFVDYLVNLINNKLQLGSAIFGDRYLVKIFDYFGFNCFKKNHLPQLFVNCFNEQLQYHYLQRVFSWECLDIKEDQLDFQPITYFENKSVLELLLNKSDGVFSFIDEASKKNATGKYIIDSINSLEKEKVSVCGTYEFSVAHYTGCVIYNSKEMPDKNRDYLPPDLVETLRLSENIIIRNMFLNKLNKTGNLLSCINKTDVDKFDDMYSSQNQYSQIKRVRTSINTFKALSLDILKELSIGSGSGGTYFVRCIRSDLKGKPNFNKELIRQQIRALAIVETAKIRQNGFPHRIPFAEFLRRYKFLAFDFNENVEITKDNCRLLLIRLKMEGWIIGKSKVFLKYYNEEYLARLYEHQVKKIIKIQSILRSYLAKYKVAKEIKNKSSKYLISNKEQEMSEEEAASIIQKKFRQTTMRKCLAECENDYKVLDEKTCIFIRKFATKWRNNSIFYVLVKYRALRLQDSFNFAQQVHLYNNAIFFELQCVNQTVSLQTIDSNANLNHLKIHVLPVNKVPFRLNDIPFYDSTYMCNSLTNPGVANERDASWDSPYRWRELVSPQLTKEMDALKETDQHLINLPYNRDPELPIKELQCTHDEPSCEIAKETKDGFSKHEKDENNKVRQRYNEVNKSTVSHNYQKNYKINSKTAKQSSQPVDPIVELIKMGSNNDRKLEDEPPFNFRAMLRKTNYIKPEPLLEQNMEQKQPNYALTKKSKAEKNEKMLTNGLDCFEEKKIKIELGSGMFLEGFEVEL